MCAAVDSRNQPSNQPIHHPTSIFEPHIIFKPYHTGYTINKVRPVLCRALVGDTIRRAGEMPRYVNGACSSRSGFSKYEPHPGRDPNSTTHDAH